MEEKAVFVGIIKREDEERKVLEYLEERHEGLLVDLGLVDRGYAPVELVEGTQGQEALECVTVQRDFVQIS